MNRKMKNYRINLEKKEIDFILDAIKHYNGGLEGQSEILADYILNAVKEQDVTKKNMEEVKKIFDQVLVLDSSKK